MNSKLNLNIRGNITISSNKSGLLYNNSNTIGPDELEIVARCLALLNTTGGVDNIQVSGDFGDPVLREIFEKEYDPVTNSVRFTTIFYETDFDGEITDLALKSLSFGDLILATKTGLSIIKDSTSRVRIDWKITIEQC